MIAQWQMYVIHVDFNSFMLFMCLFQSKKHFKGSLKPQLKGASVWPLMHAVKWLQAEFVIYDHWFLVTSPTVSTYLQLFTSACNFPSSEESKAEGGTSGKLTWLAILSPQNVPFC